MEKNPGKTHKSAVQILQELTMGGRYLGPACKAAAPGETCPVCHAGIMEYNGMLDLVCPHCGYKGQGGGFT